MNLEKVKEKKLKLFNNILTLCVQLIISLLTF